MWNQGILNLHSRSPYQSIKAEARGYMLRYDGRMMCLISPVADAAVDSISLTRRWRRRLLFNCVLLVFNDWRKVIFDSQYFTKGWMKSSYNSVQSKNNCNCLELTLSFLPRISNFYLFTRLFSCSFLRFNAFSEFGIYIEHYGMRMQVSVARSK